jgi:hypothetical protein
MTMLNILKDKSTKTILALLEWRVFSHFLNVSQGFTAQTALP